MRTKLLALSMVLILGSGALAAKVKPKSVHPAAKPTVVQSIIPVYPGGQVIAEMYLSDKDFLPAMREWVTALPAVIAAIDKSMKEDGATSPDATQDANSLASIADAKSISELEAAVSGLKSISATMYEVSKKVNTVNLNKYYDKKLGLYGWQRNLFFDYEGCSIYLYTKPGLEGIFGYMISDHSVMAFRTSGRIDLLTISKWVKKAIPAFIYIGIQEEKKHQPQQQQQAAPPTPQPNDTTPSEEESAPADAPAGVS